MRSTTAAARAAGRPVGPSRLLVVLLTSLAAMAATSLAFADGIDVSHWQGSINWPKVKAAGMQFAFMKATESTTYTDTAFATNWAGAASVGIYRGAYHFARPSTASGSAVKQADYFVSRVGSFQGAGTLPPVLDLEATGGLGVTALRTWVADLADARRAAHGPGADPLLLAVVLGDQPRQQHGLHALPALDRALHDGLAPRPRWLADLDVLAAHEQRLGERHLRQRRHEQLQRHDGPARRAGQHHRRVVRAGAAGADGPGRRDHEPDRRRRPPPRSPPAPR